MTCEVGRVFVTVGNATQPFPRLINAIQELFANGSISGDLLVQTGATPIESKIGRHVRALAPAEFERAISTADLVITHGGAGTLIHLLNAGKIPVAMPRRAVYGEHIDDHQLELVRALGSDGRVWPALDVTDLVPAIQNALGPLSARERGSSALLKEICEILVAIGRRHS